MGIVLEELRIKKAELFKSFCDEALIKAEEIFTGSKNEDYNSGGVEITDYFDCLGNIKEGAFYPMFRKALRLKSLIRSKNEEQNESKLDSCIDLINYTRFLYAAIKMSAE